MSIPVDSSIVAAAEAAQAPVVTATVTTPDAKIGLQAPPKFVRPNFERMPPELKQLKNWVLWGRSGTDRNGRSAQFRFPGLVRARPTQNTGPPSTT